MDWRDGSERVELSDSQCSIVDDRLREKQTRGKGEVDVRKQWASGHDPGCLIACIVYVHYLSLV